MCANQPPFLVLKALQLCRAQSLCRVQSMCRLYNLYMQHLSFVGSNDGNVGFVLSELLTALCVYRHF